MYCREMRFEELWSKTCSAQVQRGKTKKRRGIYIATVHTKVSVF